MYDLFLLIFRSACHIGSRMTSSENLTIPKKMFCLFPVTLLLSGALSQAGFNLFLTSFLGRGGVIIFKQQLETLESSSSNKQTKTNKEAAAISLRTSVLT